MKKCICLIACFLIACGADTSSRPADQEDLDREEAMVEGDADASDAELVEAQPWVEELCDQIPETNLWFCNYPTDWISAVLWCQQAGGNLVTVLDQETQDTITSTEVDGSWIGAHLKDGEWSWVTGEEWSFDNGSVHAGVGSCLMTSHYGSKRWAQVDCGSPLPFTCDLEVDDG